MAENRNDDITPENTNADSVKGGSDAPSQTTKDELSKAQEDAAKERAEKGGYQ